MGQGVFRRSWLAGVVSSLVAAAISAAPSVYPTGMTISKPGVQPGYVVFGAPDGSAYAIDVKGQVAAKWSAPEANTLIGYARPLANGNLLARTSVARQAAAAAGGYAEAAAVPSSVEFGQDGKLVWKYTDTVRGLHHDLERMENGNTLFVCANDIDRPDISKLKLRDDCLIEVDKAGKVVWEWKTIDHLEELGLPREAKDAIMNGYGGTRTGLGAPPATSAFDYLHMNAASPIPSGLGYTDPRFRAGNIVVSYRYINTIAVIDRASGKIVWKMVGVSIGQHHTHFIPPGLPGAGHLLVFDNGLVDENTNPMRISSRPNSRVLEIDPLTDKIVWHYSADMSNRPIWTFYSHYISGAQRQPNGNTLICEGANGRIFEVTPAGEIVWEFVNPYAKKEGNSTDNTVFRAAKVPESWLQAKK
jgi:hypothetical protein